MDREKRFERALIQDLRFLGVFAHHFDAVGCDGWPDILCLYDNKVLLVECKYNTEELRIDQKAFIAMMMGLYRFDKLAKATLHSDGVFRLNGVEVGDKIRHLSTAIFNELGGLDEYDFR